MSQKTMPKRRLYGNLSSCARFSCATGLTVFRYANIASASARVSCRYDVYGIDGYRRLPGALPSCSAA